MTKVFGVSGDLLKQCIQKIEHLEQEKQEILTNIRDAYAEAKSQGFEPKILRQIVKERKIDRKILDEQDYLLTTYKRALGMLPELDEAA